MQIALSVFNDWCQVGLVLPDNPLTDFVTYNYPCHWGMVGGYIAGSVFPHGEKGFYCFDQPLRQVG